MKSTGASTSGFGALHSVFGREPRSARRIIGLLLIAFGLVCIGLVITEVSRRSWFQREQQITLARAVDGGVITVPSRSAMATGQLVGRLEIQRLGLSVMVVQGDDEATLAHAVGHLPDTPMPWDAGNVALAGHRDSFFRPLKDVKAGDVIRLESPRGLFVYRVRSTHVTDPSDISVLASTPGPVLTLVTCYPFYYIGSAPKRFIVQADRIESD